MMWTAVSLDSESCGYWCALRLFTGQMMPPRTAQTSVKVMMCPKQSTRPSFGLLAREKLYW